MDLRNFLESVNRKVNGFISERGVLATSGGNGFAVSQNGTPNFSVNVAAGRAIINDGEVTNGGVAYVWSDATFNLTTPSPPASGTNLHRVVLQLRNKLENGTYTTYDFTPLLVADTSTGGSGTFPAEPTSAITLAKVSITAGQANVSNSNITDYREIAGPANAYKASATSRSSTSMTSDPDLQLLNLASNAIYALEGYINYTGGTGTSEGDLSYTWSTPNATMVYNSIRAGTGAGNISGVNSNVGSDTVQAGTQGSSTPVGILLSGSIDTGNAPCSAVFQWGLVTSGAGITNTSVNAGSYLRATRIR